MSQFQEEDKSKYAQIYARKQVMELIWQLSLFRCTHIGTVQAMCCKVGLFCTPTQCWVGGDRILLSSFLSKTVKCNLHFVSFIEFLHPNSVLAWGRQGDRVLLISFLSKTSTCNLHFQSVYWFSKLLPNFVCWSYVQLISKQVGSRKYQRTVIDQSLNIREHLLTKD